MHCIAICVYIQLPSLTMYRSLQFYLTIEKALLCGNPLLVESVTTPFDPALQPLLEMLHTWNNKSELSLKIAIYLLYYTHDLPSIYNVLVNGCRWPWYFHSVLSLYRAKASQILWSKN